MDEIDMRILEVLMRDGREKFVKIAKDLGVSEATVRKRVKKMMKEGIIEQFTCLVNAKKIGKDRVFIGLDLEPEFYIDGVREIEGLDLSILRAYECTGDHNLLLECVCDGLKGMESILERLKRVRGVRRVCPAVVVRRIK